jgi:hypothetical protein
VETPQSTMSFHIMGWIIDDIQTCTFLLGRIGMAEVSISDYCICIFVFDFFAYMCILLVLIQLYWLCDADVGPNGHEVDVAQGMADEQAKGRWVRR